MALLILGVKNGIGGHITAASLKNIGESLKVSKNKCSTHFRERFTDKKTVVQYIWFLEVIYVILTSIMKASIATTLLQWAQKKVHIMLLWAAIVIDALICLVFVFYLIFQCKPVSYAWTFLDPKTKGHCAPFTGQLYMGYALCIVTITLDMLFLFVPFFMMAGRGIGSRLKLYIYGIFGLGVL